MANKSLNGKTAMDRVDLPDYLGGRRTQVSDQSDSYQEGRMEGKRLAETFSRAIGVVHTPLDAAKRKRPPSQ